MSAAAAAVVQATRLSSGREACSCRCSTACCPAPGLRRGGVPRLAAAQRQQAYNSSASRAKGSSSSSRRRRPLPPRAAAEAEAPQQAGALVPDRQGYRSFQLEGAEFLIAQTPEGKLDLRDAYVAPDVEGDDDDGAEPSYRRVEGAEGIGGQPQAYHEVPWYSEYPGDAIAEKPGRVWVSGQPGGAVALAGRCDGRDVQALGCLSFSGHLSLLRTMQHATSWGIVMRSGSFVASLTWLAPACLPTPPTKHPPRVPPSQVWRVYLVPVVADDPEGELELSFDNIYVLDGKAASLQLCEVHRLAPPDTPPRDLRLRIRCGCQPAVAAS